LLVNGQPVPLQVRQSSRVDPVPFVFTAPGLNMRMDGRGDQDARIVKSVVVGYVQPTSTAANDTTLSTARAQAVAAYLRSLGVKGVYLVRGDGKAKETGSTARRVEVTISYQAPSQPRLQSRTSVTSR